MTISDEQNYKSPQHDWITGDLIKDPEWLKWFHNMNRVYKSMKFVNIVGDLDDISDGTSYRKASVTAIDANGLVVLSEATGSLADIGGDLDDIDDGTTYSRILKTDVSAGHILLTETIGTLDSIDDGATYKKVLSTDISSGHILLSETVGDLDDIDNGTTYGRVNTTAIDAGKIKLTGDGVTGTLSTTYTAADVTADNSQNLSWLDGSAGTLTISSTGNLAISATSGLSIESGGGMLIKSGGDISVQSGGGVIIEDGGDLILEGTTSDPGKIIWRGDNIDVEWSAEGDSDLTSASYVDFTGLSSGVLYKVVLDLTVNTAGDSLLLRFNNDTGSNYDYGVHHSGVNSTGSALHAVSYNNGATSILLVDGADTIFGEFFFKIDPSDDTTGMVGGGNIAKWQDLGSGDFVSSSSTPTGYYDGSSSITSIRILLGTNTFNGKIMLFKWF